MFLLLPPDLQLEVIRLLDPRDIVNLQLTCRHINDLINEAGTFAWLGCLQRHCQRNQLFAPSYDNLSTVSDYKHAVTAPLRFSRAYDEAVLRPGKCMTSVATNLELDRDDKFDPEHDVWARWVDRQIRDVYLIRGGRFLIVWTNTSYEIWDLHTTPRPKLTFSQNLGRVDYLMYTNAPTNNQVHLLWSRAELMPDHLIDTWSAGRIGHCERWILVELNYGAAEGFVAKRYEHIFIYSSPMNCPTDLNIVSGEGRFLFISSDLTLLWDYRLNYFAGWTLEVQSSLTYTELFLMQDYLIYISSDALHGLRLSHTAKPEPVRGNYVDFRDLCTSPLLPSFSIPHDRPFVFEGYDVGSPDLCQPSDGSLSMVYDIRCRRPTAPGFQDAPPDLYRYAFTLNPDNPTESNLEFLQVLKCTFPNSTFDVSPSALVNYHQRCDGRFGVTWYNRVALSKLVPSLSADADTELREVRLQFVPLHERRLARAALCPASSKAVVQFKEVDEFGTVTAHLIMFDFR